MSAGATGDGATNAPGTRTIGPGLHHPANQGPAMSMAAPGYRCAQQLSPSLRLGAQGAERVRGEPREGSIGRDKGGAAARALAGFGFELIEAGLWQVYHCKRSFARSCASTYARLSSSTFECSRSASS